MTEPLPDVWITRDYPVLREVVRRIDAGEHAPSAESVADAIGMSIDDVQLAGAALMRRNLVTAFGALGVTVLRFKDVSGSAYLMTGLHPDGDNAISQFVSALHQAVEETQDPEEKSRLRKLADAAGGVSRDVLGGVLTAMITTAGRGLMS